MSDPDISAMTFEAAMAELEKVVARLESPQVGLEESIRLYETGDRLRTHCEAKLKDAEMKVSQITADGDGAISAQPVKGG